MSMYPLLGLDEEYMEQLAPFRASKGTVKIPLDQPIPYDLIERVVAHLVELRPR